MEEERRSSNAVVIFAILALLVLVGVGAWFFKGRGAQGPSRTTTGQTAPSREGDSDVDVKVDLPDTIKIGD